ncbi:hypothetical protein M885DRAFT_566797 [Pelagophyceae sp. CCMP2097]|nr:hypothetical protein M885DRAFT_566797 [Pelagophyceae sp. CCMP2097]
MAFEGLLVLLGVGAARAFTINGLFSDGMVVLQTTSDGGGGPGRLFGSGEPGEVVTATGTWGWAAAVTCDEDGAWSLEITGDSEIEVWGPYAAELSNASGFTVSATDVYFGDVYLCGGQSNMERAVNTIENKTIELALSDHANVRLFAVPKRADAQPGRSVVAFSEAGVAFGYLGMDVDTPAYDSNDMQGSCLYGDCSNPCSASVRRWRQANATWVQHFSALCYLSTRDTARDRGTLNDQSGRAVGLIEDDFGGTPVQAWTPFGGLEKCGLPLNDCPTEKGGNCTDYPSALYNTMISPLVGRGLRAVLWMQGEANSDEGFPLSREDYACAFREMIRAWRLAWSSPIPFIFVQLSSWVGNANFDGLACDANFCPVVSRVRLAQADVAGVGNASQAFADDKVGVVMAFDYGDDLAHGVPAQRLSWQVRCVAFGEAIHADAPLPLLIRNAAKEGLAWTRNSETVVVKVALDRAVELRGTNACNITYTGECCSGAGLVVARLCANANAADCEANDAAFVFPARLQATAGAEISFIATVPVGKVPKWLDAYRTDFALCGAADVQTGISMGTFAYLPLQTASSLPLAATSASLPLPAANA